MTTKPRTCPLCGGHSPYRPEGCTPWCAEMVLVDVATPYPFAHHDSTSPWWVHGPSLAAA